MHGYCPEGSLFWVNNLLHTGIGDAGPWSISENAQLIWDHGSYILCVEAETKMITRYNRRMRTKIGIDVRQGGLDLFWEMSGFFSFPVWRDGRTDGFLVWLGTLKTWKILWKHPILMYCWRRKPARYLQTWLSHGIVNLQKNVLSRLSFKKEKVGRPTRGWA